MSMVKNRRDMDNMGRRKYCKEIVYIGNSITGEEVTSYTVPREYDSVPIAAAVMRFEQCYTG
jgi:hypothetical protein